MSLKVGSKLVLLAPGETASGRRLPLYLRPLDLIGQGVVFPPTHESTLTCIEHLEGTRPRGQRVLEIGTGSGILAIAAAKLGADYVLATESDNFALQEARLNAALNLTTIDFKQTDALPEGQYDIVIANLGDEPVFRLGLATKLAHATRLIVVLKDTVLPLDLQQSTTLADGSRVCTYRA